MQRKIAFPSFKGGNLIAKATRSIFFAAKRDCVMVKSCVPSEYWNNTVILDEIILKPMI